MSTGSEAEDMERIDIVARVSPYGSSHDRAVELFYSLRGGRVDYGEEHARRFGHDRFGSHVKAAFPEWSEDAPVVFVAHSHGGNTARVLQKLLHVKFFGVDTSAAWILAIVCIASPLNGCALLHRLGMPRRSSCPTRTHPSSGAELGQSTGRWFSVVRVGQTCGYVAHWCLGDVEAINRLYDWGLTKWNVAHRTWAALREILSGTHTMMNTDDTAGFELTPEGASALNATLPLHKCTYYVTVPCTHGMVLFDAYLPRPTVAFWMLPLGLLHAAVAARDRLASKDVTDDTYRRRRFNDLMVPLDSQEYPEGQDHVRLHNHHDTLRRGVWNVLPVQQCDHFTSSSLADVVLESYAVWA